MPLWLLSFLRSSAPPPPPPLPNRSISLPLTDGRRLFGEALAFVGNPLTGPFQHHLNDFVLKWPEKPVFWLGDAMSMADQLSWRTLNSLSFWGEFLKSCNITHLFRHGAYGRIRTMQIYLMMHQPVCIQCLKYSYAYNSRCCVCKNEKRTDPQRLPWQWWCQVKQSLCLNPEHQASSYSGVPDEALSLHHIMWSTIQEME